MVVKESILAGVVVLLVAACGSVSDPGETSSATSTTARPITTTTPTTTITTTTTTATAPTTTLPEVPSQTAADAARDGVIPELASVPFEVRVSPFVDVVAEEGTWILTRPTDALINRTMSTGCGFGKLDGTYPIDVICASEYGEVLLVDDAGEIARAYPMPGAVPSWLHVTDGFVYAGRVGDGALPDSALVRIDRASLEATVVVIPASFDGGTEWLPGWLIASDEQAARYEEAVQVGADSVGTEVANWIGTVRSISTKSTESSRR